AQLWWGSAERLNALGHACATVDQRGHGRSDKPDDGYTLERAWRDLMAVIEALRSGDWFGPRLIVAGQSWGANVVLELGWQHPEAVAGVVCVDGGTIELSARFADWESCAGALAPPRLVGTPRTEIEAYFRSAHGDWPESGIEASLANFETREDGTIAPWLTFERHMKLLRALWEHRPSSRYPEMKVPVLLVPADSGGRTGSVSKRDEVDAAVAAIPAARAHWFSPADHDIHAQHPVELADLMHSEATDGVLA
ncbi:MAG TPA: alpha/beta hydrolase, partial [Acidimicrobiales bacterium]|nr:alpha/beta hydrolase [Acidimicrobiales bacterium]